MQNPNEEKFKKINAENPNFKARVGDIIGGKVLLKEAGFEENGTFLEFNGKDGQRTQELVEAIDKTLSMMN